MAAHDPHDGPDDAVLYDNCAECTNRASDGIKGALHLGPESLAKLWQRMIAIEYRADSDRYRSKNEARLGRELYYVSLLAERNPFLLFWRPGENV